MSTRRLCAALFAAVAGAILVLALATTAAVANGASPKLRSIFRPLCHGIEDRCFAIAGVAMPLCARCTGIYAGMIGGALAALVVRRFAGGVAFALALPMIVDGVTQALLLRESTNALRFATGLTAAAAFTVWALARIGRSDPMSGSSRARTA